MLQGPLLLGSVNLTKLREAAFIRGVAFRTTTPERQSEREYHYDGNENFLVTHVLPNEQHQLPEPAAAEQRIQADLNGWLRSAECWGSESFGEFVRFSADERGREGTPGWLSDSPQDVCATVWTLRHLLVRKIRFDVVPRGDFVRCLVVLDRPLFFRSGNLA
jgi:hypothetical protein